MKTITNLAQSRIRFHRSRTVFTVIAILLTTILLMGLGTSAMGLINGQKQMAASQNNYHAVMKNLTAEQLNTLASHMDVEAVQAQEIFAKIQYEKMNGLLTWSDSRKGSIYQGVGNLTAGRLARGARGHLRTAGLFQADACGAQSGNPVFHHLPAGRGRIHHPGVCHLRPGV